MVSSFRGAILIAAADIEAQQYLETALVSQGFTVQLADGVEDIFRTLKAVNHVSLLLLDQLLLNRIPHTSFPPDKRAGVIGGIRSINKHLPIVVMTSGSNFSDAVDQFNCYQNLLTISKPVFYDDLAHAISELLPTDSESVDPPSLARSYFEFSAEAQNPRMRLISKLIDQAARSEVPVLVQGETGVGKEMLVREIHARSRRGRGPFVNINCAALPKELVESQLFGHERGAFTGAHRSQPGLFEVADGGTILLDEIGDMDIRLQAKLLQVLQDNEFHRLGGSTVRVDVRVMAATHRDLNEAVASGRMRADLFYRLKVVSIVIPPMRERRDEIVALAEFFLRKHTRAEDTPPEIDLAVKRQLLSYHWPGNVRELENMMRRYLVLRDSAVFQDMRTLIDEDYAEPSYVASASAGPARSNSEVKPAKIEQAKGEHSKVRRLEGEHPRGSHPRADHLRASHLRSDHLSAQSSIFDSLDQTKRQAQTEALVAALNASQWNRKKAADILRLDYKQLLYQMKKLQVEGASRRTRSRSGPKGAASAVAKSDRGATVSDPWVPVRQLS